MSAGQCEKGACQELHRNIWKRVLMEAKVHHRVVQRNNKSKDKEIIAGANSVGNKLQATGPWPANVNHRRFDLTS